MNPKPLFDAARHEPMTATPWSDSAAREAIARIADDALHAFTPQGQWPAHPLDDPETPATRHLAIYHGAGGVIWALQHLRSTGAIGGDFDFGATIATLVEDNRALIADWDDPHGSYLLGDVGLLLLQWQATRDAGIADALFARVEANLRHKALEALWGSPGSLIASIHMAEVSGEPRWRDQLERGLRILLEAMVYDAALGAWLWVQDLYGKQRRFLGAGHGFAGNTFPALRGAKWLPADLVETCVERALQTLTATAVRDGAAINWEPVHDSSGALPSKLLMQDCHGAPGIVYTLDWDNRAVVRHRLHWVHAEAAAAASALLKRTDEAKYEAWYRRFWEFCDKHFIDRCNGSWHHELDPQNRPSADIWPGKPDLYHAWQAVLIPRLPLAPSMASALARLSSPAPV